MVCVLMESSYKLPQRRSLATRRRLLRAQYWCDSLMVVEHGTLQCMLVVSVRPHPPHRQWLPPAKVEYLGVNKEFDRFQITGSGASKRSVQQAYERALRYQRKVMQSNADDSDCSSAS